MEPSDAEVSGSYRGPDCTALAPGRQRTALGSSVSSELCAIGPTNSDPLPEILAIHIGFNSGPVVVGKIGDNLRMDYTAIGDTTILAGRLQRYAEPDAALLSEATQRLVGGYVGVETIEALSIKGRTEPIRGSSPCRSGHQTIAVDPIKSASAWC